MNKLVFEWPDYGALFVYLGILIIGAYFSTRKQSGSSEYFTGNRSIPTWAAALSFLATAQSAATFVGGPQSSYGGSLNYFLGNIGFFLGILIMGFVFLPVYYKHNLQTVYGLLEIRFGRLGGMSGSLGFLVGRSIASGSRLFIAACAVCYLFSGTLNIGPLLTAVCALTIMGIAFTYVGGIRTVIWTDVIQFIIYMGVLGLAVFILWDRIGLGFSEVYHILDNSGVNNTSKLSFFDNSETSLWVKPYSLPSVFIGLTLLNLAIYATDHDIAQRFLTCKNAKEGIKTTIIGAVVNLPVQLFFLIIGLLLFVLYQKSELITGAPPGTVPDNSQKIFLNYITYELPVGVKGIMLAGILATALSSVNSAINAMSASFVNDLYKKVYPDLDDTKYLQVGKFFMLLFGLGISACAMFFAFTQVGSDKPPLLDFALMVMVYTNSGMLGAFSAAIFTKRGTGLTCLLAIVTGFFFTLYCNDLIDYFFYGKNSLVEAKDKFKFGFGWLMTFGTILSFLVCIIVPSKPQLKSEEAQNA